MLCTLNESFEKRKFLQSIPNENVTNAYRLCNGIADKLNGLVIDKYNAHYQIQFFNDALIKHENEIIQFLLNKFLPECIVVKYRFVNKSEIKQVFGKNSKTTVIENGIKFNVDLLDTLNPGLFLDMRDARDFFGSLCSDKEILNLFAYTCSFGVYAKKNKALKTVNVDISKKNLNKGKENYLLNGLEIMPGDFFCGSSEEYVAWAIKKNKKFNAIVIDPPSFARNNNKTFSVANDFENLISNAVGILDTKGVLLLATNYSEWNAQTLLKITYNAFERNNKEFKILKKGSSGEDFITNGLSKECNMNYIVVCCEP